MLCSFELLVHVTSMHPTTRQCPPCALSLPSRTFMRSWAPLKNRSYDYLPVEHFRHLEIAETNESHWAETFLFIVRELGRSVDVVEWSSRNNIEALEIPLQYRFTSSWGSRNGNFHTLQTDLQKTEVFISFPYIQLICSPDEGSLF